MSTTRKIEGEQTPLPTTRAEEIAGEGPYGVETFPNGGTFNSRWFGMGRRGVFTTESGAKDACLELNIAYKQGQQDRWPHHLTEENIDTMAQFIAGQLDNDGHHNRYDAAKKALTMYRDHILTP